MKQLLKHCGALLLALASAWGHAMNPALLPDVLTLKEQGIEGHGADVETSTPEQLGEMVRKDLAKWRQVVLKAKLQAD